MTELNESMKRLEIPLRMQSLPISAKGYPTPWFAARNPDTGELDLRIADTMKRDKAYRHRLCWVCGEKVGRFLCFVIGPMCVVNRVTSEPGCHLECASFSVKGCPFLTKPRMVRNKGELPEETRSAPGVMIERNPGVCCIYVTKDFRLFKADNGMLVKLGDGVACYWYREGRKATRAEIMDSIASGYPLLVDMAKKDGADAMRQLTAQYNAAMNLLPA